MKQAKMQLLALLGTLLFLLVFVLVACVVPTVPPQVASETPATAEAATGEGEEIVITHAQGETTVVKNPAVVVVFDYSVLDTLDQLGVPVAAVPQGTNIPAFLEKYKGSEYANAGTLFEPDYEKVNELQPDLIIVAGRSSTVYLELAKIAPTIDLTLQQPTFIEDFKRNLTTLGLIFGQEDEIASQLTAIDESIARVRAKAEASGATALIVMATGGEVTAFGPGSRFGLIHDVLGVAPVVAEIETETHGDAISFEFILDKNPDMLFIIDRDSATGEASESAAQIMDNDLVKATNAYTNNKLVYLEPTTWYLANAGLSSVPAMIAEVEAALE